jgi:membrane-bound lytic murein transglycosylase B
VSLPIILSVVVAMAMMFFSSFFSLQASSEGIWSSSERATDRIKNLSAADTCLSPNEKFFAPVLRELLLQGADSSFIRLLMDDSRTSFNETLVRINVVGQRRRADYGHNYTELAVRSVREFVDDHDSLLTAVQEQYGVPKEVISALMYVETKHGQVTGLHHVPSVYLSVAMSSEPEYIEKNKQAMREHFDGSEDEAKELEEKIEQRAAKKAAWAVRELLALNKMRATSPIPIMALYGSWAGAFGWSQFLPSSYVRCAVDGDNDGKINLFTLPDAAHSVGNYLKLANWSADKPSQRKALYAYNNSEDYVSSILALARRAAELDGSSRKKLLANQTTRAARTHSATAAASSKKSARQSSASVKKSKKTAQR